MDLQRGGRISVSTDVATDGQSVAINEALITGV